MWKNEKRKKYMKQKQRKIILILQPYFFKTENKGSFYYSNYTVK